MKLYLGNKNYSSWSLRPWLVLKESGASFEEEVVHLDRPDTKSRIAAFSPSGRVPVLVDGDVRIWDSLAISEYVAEKFPQAKLWPEDRAARAHARAVSCEMHSGFAALRENMPMNVRARLPGKGRTPEVLADIARIQAIWSAKRGPFLFGHFTIADAMFAPVALRFVTYDVEMESAPRAYVDALLALPAMKEWIATAAAEEAAIAKYER
jgi:glutathione S-transferase